MTTCFYCGQEATDLERHAEQSEPCARKALEFVRGLPNGYADVAGSFSRQDKAAALRRCRARLNKARGPK